MLPNAGIHYPLLVGRNFYCLVGRDFSTVSPSRGQDPRHCRHKFPFGIVRLYRGIMLAGTGRQRSGLPAELKHLRPLLLPGVSAISGWLTIILMCIGTVLVMQKTAFGRSLCHKDNF